MFEESAQNSADEDLLTAVIAGNTRWVKRLLKPRGLYLRFVVIECCAASNAARRTAAEIAERLGNTEILALLRPQEQVVEATADPSTSPYEQPVRLELVSDTQSAAA